MHKKLIRLGPWLAIFLFICTTAALVTRYVELISAENPREGSETSYRYHVAMITNDQDVPYWEQVHAGAQAQADGYGALIERVGANLLEKMSVADQLEMALYSEVDGVLVYPEDNYEVQCAINKVVAHSIPVITMQRDSTLSHRQAFVGINDYFLGQEYGRQIQHRAGDGNHIITILYPGSTFGAESRSWFWQGLSSTLDQQRYAISSHIILENEGLSNAESTIDDIIEGADNVIAPDILICLNDTITEVAYRIVEDRGAEGLVQIVGGSISDTIIDGIERGGIAFTITPNPEDTGRKAFRELERYFRHGVANYASTVELQVISAENVAAYQDDAASVDGVQSAPGLVLSAGEGNSDLRAGAGAESPALAEGAEENPNARAGAGAEAPALAEAAEVVS